MKCSKCGSKMKRIRTSKIALKAVKMLGVGFAGSWQCPNRMNHKRRK